MKRLAVALAVLLAATLGGSAGRATAGPAGDIDWGVANWAAGVQMATSWPSETDPHVHGRFKRVGGDGQRQVRMAERHWRKDVKRWSAWSYHGPVKLAVGEKVVFTTDAALVCEPRKQPVGVRLEMRNKPQGKPWKQWQTWSMSDYYLMEC